MKKRNVVFILALIIGFTQFTGCLNAGTQDAGQENAKAGILPQALSPEETLKIYLNAFISRDIDTVMAYLPNGTGKQITAWRERAKALSQARMSDKKHVIAIDSIKLIKIETQDSAKRAIMEATIVTTPNFSEAVTCDGQGKCTASLQWTFRQYKQDGPWLFDGGGF
jgi:hypothetical protein